jgi:hypothetical protein
MQDLVYGLPGISLLRRWVHRAQQGSAPVLYPHTPGAGDGGRAASVVAADLRGVGEGTSGGYSPPLALRTHAAFSADMT